jgi:hypothetical protein
VSFDGWSDINLNDLLGATVTTPKRINYVLGAVDLRGQAHTGKRLSFE